MYDFHKSSMQHIRYSKLVLCWMYFSNSLTFYHGVNILELMLDDEYFIFPHNEAWPFSIIHLQRILILISGRYASNQRYQAFVFVKMNSFCRVCDALKDSKGEKLFRLEKNKLVKLFGKEEGQRLYSQITVQKKNNGVSMLMYFSYRSGL